MNKLKPLEDNTKKEFAEWASAKDRFSGMFGDINSKIWFCGIEPGGDYSINYAEDDKLPKSIDSAYIAKNKNYGGRGWGFYRTIAKLMVGIGMSDISINSLQDISSTFFKDYFFRKNKDILLSDKNPARKIYDLIGGGFLLNIYPLPFINEKTWHDKYKDLFANKEQYREWSKTNRSPNLAQIFYDKGNKARILICSASEQSKEKCISAFGEGTDQFNTYKIYNKDIIHFSKNNKHVFICPFFRVGIFNRNTEIDALAEYIRQTVNL